MEYLGTIAGARLLKMLEYVGSHERLTGLLEFEHAASGVRNLFSLREGQVIHASSTLYHNLFGDILVMRNLITPEALTKALQEQKISPQKIRLGNILLKMGAISETVIPKVLFQQIEQALYEAICWPGVRVYFEEGELSDDADYIMPISYEVVDGQVVNTAAGFDEAINSRVLLKEAKQNFATLSQIRHTIPDLTAVPRVAPGADVNTLNHSKIRLLNMINGRMSIQMIGVVSDLPYFKTLETLAQLVDSGHVVLSTPREVPNVPAIEDIATETLQRWLSSTSAYMGGIPSAKPAQQSTSVLSRLQNMRESGSPQPAAAQAPTPTVASSATGDDLDSIATRYQIPKDMLLVLMGRRHEVPNSHDTLLESYRDALDRYRVLLQEEKNRHSAGNPSEADEDLLPPALRDRLARLTPARRRPILTMIESMLEMGES